MTQGSVLRESEPVDAAECLSGGLRYLDVCAGISAPTAAWKPLGWQALVYAEIADAPRAVLRHHYPDVPLVGDFTEIKGDEYGPVDLLVGGTPCQSFSVAGLRGGLADDRGNLALEYLRLADRARPRWLVWENVPGVLSSNGGRDFGAILGGMVELGYGVAYRVLDAQFFGVPQRRRRVFVVGHLGDWRRAAAVLFERHGLSGNPAPRRQTGQGIANAITERPDRGGGNSEGQRLIPSTGEISHCLNAGGMGRQDYETETLIAHSLRAEGFDASEDGTGRGTPLIVDTLTSNGAAHSGFRDEKGLVPISYGVAIDTTGHQGDKVIGEGDVWPCLAAQNANNGGGGGGLAHVSSAVRRLTPRECERLQGFPDDFTLVPHRGRMMADGPRYKCLGNSMAVPVVRWIGERIESVEAISEARAAA